MIPTDTVADCDAILIVSFGGPEGPEDVLPFLENVLRGKNVPRERMLEVAEHYQHFGGVSPINEQNRQLIAALREELARHEIRLPIYWGNRNWHPLLADTLAQMRADGITNAVAFFTSAFSCYSGCRQYREDLQQARELVGEGAPKIAKLRMFFNHPDFVAAMADRVAAARSRLADPQVAPRLLFTAHSIPLGMAENCRYEEQLREACHLISDAVGIDDYELVYQSRSGPPQQPWLEPDVCDRIRQLAATSQQSLVICPVGFVSDHMEVLYDLDTEARQVCDELGIEMVRASTPGTHPQFVAMIRKLIAERITPGTDRPALGTYGPSHDVCPTDCCRYTPARPPARAPT